MATCKLCGENRQLIKAHIIPRQLYKPIRQASIEAPPRDQAPWIFTTRIGQGSTQVQNGIQDSSILCHECDNKLLGPWDAYGQKFLKNLTCPVKTIVDSTDKYTLCEVEDFDYKQLKLFFMSVLFRAHITSNEFFSQVNLGQWMKKLKKMILDQNPGDQNDFSVILFKYEGDLSEIMPNPVRQKEDGVDFYRFRIPNYGFLIKVDKKKFSHGLNYLILKPNMPFQIVSMNYMDSAEYKNILEIRNQLSK